MNPAPFRGVMPSLPRACSLLASCFATVCFIVCWATPLAAAQDNNWSVLLTVQANPSPFVAEWERNPQMAVLRVMYTGSAPDDYKVEARVTHQTRGRMGIIQSPPLSVPFGPYTQLFSATDVTAWHALEYDDSFAAAALRTGVLPEGQYQLCVRVLSLEDSLRAEECESFTITFPDPPQLIFPDQGGQVPAIQPIFQWTPVMTPPEVGVTYRIRIVERQAQQTAQAALSANPVHFQGEVRGAPTLVYPLDALPLEPDRQYVWQVEVLDDDGRRLTAGGVHSEIWAFQPYEIGVPTLVDEMPDSLVLVPGVAVLHGLAAVQVDATDFSFVLNGQATLDLLAPYQASVQVQLSGLEVDAPNPLAPSFIAGRLDATIDPGTFPEALTGQYLQITELDYTPADGLSVAAAATLPDQPNIQLSGRAEITPSGFWGSLVAEATAPEALFTLGNDPVRLSVERVSITLPDIVPDISAQLELFGTIPGCRTSGGLEPNGILTALVSCAPDEPIQLVPGVDRAGLTLSMVTGNIDLDLNAPSPLVDYALTVSGGLRLDAPGGSGCGARFDLELGMDGLALGPESFTPRCEPGQGAAALDWLEARLSALGVEQFDYTPETGFQFLLRVDMQPAIPDVPGLLLPPMVELTIDNDGLTIPPVDVGVDHPGFQLGGFGLQVHQVRLPGFTLSWQDWQVGSADDFAFDLDATLSFPQLPQVVPECLAGLEINLQDLALADGRIAVTLPEEGFTPACQLPLGGGAALTLEQLAGELAVRFSPDLELESLPTVEGGLALPDFFDCPADVREMGMPGAQFTLGPGGELTGQATGLAPPCPIQLPAVQINVTDASLDFAFQDGSQSAVLASSATGTFSAAEPVTGTGEVEIDLLAAQLLSGSLTFTGPFRFDLPRNNPVFSFQVQSAVMDRDGLHMDGRGGLALGAADTVGVTFDEATLNPQQLRLSSGRISFDLPFAFEVGIGADGGLGWNAVPAGSPLEVETGLRLNLPAAIALEPTGFVADGDASARILFEGQDLEDVIASFTNEFALSLDPPGVTRGAIDLEIGGVRIGYIDATGFHPNLSYFGTALLPERLGLPSVDVAYLELRDADGNLRVQTETTNDGIRLFTPAGELVPLRIPALEPEPVLEEARVDVAFDVTIDPLGAGFVDGSLGVRVPEVRRPAFSLRDRGVPFTIDTLSYGPDAGGVYRFALGGRLDLFGEEHGEEASVFLELDATGRIAGELDLPLLARFPLVPESDRLTLAVDTIRGWFDAKLAGGSPRFELELAGGLELEAMSDATLRAAATLELSDLGLNVKHLQLPDLEQDLGLDLGPVRAAIREIQDFSLEYEFQQAEWSFELVMDMAFQLAELAGVETPSIAGIAIRRDGITIPQVAMPLSLEPFTLGGFSLQPLYFRMDSVRVDWFAGQLLADDDWGIGLDLEIGFPQLPADMPVALRNTRVTVLNAGYRNGLLTGAIEPRFLDDPIELRFDDDGLGFQIRQLAGDLMAIGESQEIEITLGGSFMAPSFMRCGDAPEGSYFINLEHDTGVVGTGDPPAGDIAGPSALLTLSSAGRISGQVSGFVPACPLDLGPVALGVTTSDLIFDVEAGRQLVELDLAGYVRLPSPTPGETINVAGELGVDLVNVEILRGFIEITEPFRWNLPAEDPLLQFVVSQARLDGDGLRLSGSGMLDLSAEAEAEVPGVQADAAAAAQVGVTFDNLQLSLPDFQVTGGEAHFDHAFAFDVGIDPQGKLQWRARPEDEPREDGPGLRLVLPDTALVGPDGLRLGGTAGAEFEFADQDFPSVMMEFTDGFMLGFQPVGVDAGRANLMVDGSLVAYVDRHGFWPGDVFGVMPIPGQLGLPSEEVAYLRLRDDDDNLLIQSEISGDGMRIWTDDTGVQLVAPVLAPEDGPPPSATVTFDVTVNPVTWQFTAGAVTAQADPGGHLFSLRDLGLPLDVVSIDYDDDEDLGFALRLDARLELPESMGGADVVFENIVVTESGLAGSAEIGQYSDLYNAELEPFLERELGGGVWLALLGARATFDDENEFLLSGKITAPLLGSEGPDDDGVFFTAGVDAAGFHATAYADQLPAEGLPIGMARFQPMAIGQRPALGIRATSEEIGVELSGVLSVPSLAEGFAVTVEGLEVGSFGVRLPELALETPEDMQEFNLFGAKLVLKDTLGTAAIQFAMEEDILLLTLAGEITFLDNTTWFRGLRIGSDGSVSLEEASLISEPIVVLADVLTLDSLTIREGRMRADLGLTPPAPLGDGETHGLYFSVGPGGDIDGGGSIVIFDEEPGLGDEQTLLPLGVGTLHPRYARLILDFAAFQENSAVELVADFYLEEDLDKRIKIGDVRPEGPLPGLRLGFDGSVSWGHFELPREFHFDWDVVRLTISEIAVPETEAGFAVSLSGEIGLRLAAVDGGLAFERLTLTSAGDISIGDATVRGGELSITDAVRVELTGFEFSPDPTTIEIAGGSTPDADNPDASPATESVDVTSFVRFGGRVEVVDLFAGGVEEFLFYRTPEDEVRLLVRQATLDVYDVLSFRADLAYAERDGGFAIDLGAQGQFLGEFEVALVGMLSNMPGEDMRAGLFLSATAAIPIPPAIVLTGVGGGFFYNPKPEHIDLVRQYAGVGGPAQNKLDEAESDRFAVFLYGAAAIISQTIIEGRMLVTLTDNHLGVDGAMTVLNQGDRLTGHASLQVGLRRVYAEGSFGIQVDYGGVVTGSAGLEFFVYADDAWGIMGHLDYDLAGGVLSGDGELFVGPPGFLLAGSMEAGFDVWLISFDNWVSATIWYRRAAAQWGAHVALGVDVSVLGGLASATGTLDGALITSPGTLPHIYAWAMLQAQIVGASWEGGVYAMLQDGSVSGGFGSNPALTDVINEAKNVRDEMEQSRQDAESALADAAAASLPAIALTDEELARGYENVQGAHPAFFFLGAQLPAAHELQTAPQPGESEYLSWYLDLLRGIGAPNDTAQIRTFTQQLEDNLAEIATRRDAVSARIAALDADVQDLHQLAAGPPLASPVVSANFQRPVTEISVDAAGDTVKVLISGPSFEVDAEAEAAARDSAMARQAAAAMLEEQLVERIETLESSLDAIRQVTTARDEGSLLDFARVHSEARIAAESQYAWQVQHVLGRRDWAAATLDSLETQLSSFEAITAQKASTLATQDIHDLIDHTTVRLTALEVWTGRDDLVSEYEETVYEVTDQQLLTNYLVDQSITTGMDLWYNVGHAGLTSMVEGADTEYGELRAAGEARLSNVRDSHQQLSRSLDQLFLNQADLTGVLFDLYNLYADLRSGEGGTRPSPPQAITAGENDVGNVTTSLDMATARARLDELREELNPPRVTDVSIHTRNEGYRAWTSFSWAGTHPGGIYEYLFEDQAGTDVPYTGMVSRGARGLLTTYLAVPELGVTEQERTFQHGVRGGAGFVGMGRATYTAYFAEGGGGRNRMTRGSAVQDTTPPPTPRVTFPGKHVRVVAGMRQVWTANPTRFTVEWSAIDPESGIAGYEFAVGTTPGGTDLADWMDMGGRTRTTVEPSRVSPNRPVHVSVRARNGVGMWSDIGTSHPIYLDTVGPSWPADAQIRPGRMSSADDDPTQVAHYPVQPDLGIDLTITTPLPACPVPEIGFPGGGLQGVHGGTTAQGEGWTGSLGATDESVDRSDFDPVITGEPARARFRRPDAVDTRSGIRDYYWRIGQVPPAVFDENTWTLLEGAPREFTVEGAPLEYGEEFYMALVAVNYAGMATEPLVYGPFQPMDETPPQPPVICVGIGSATGTLRVYFEEPAVDAETGIAGYAYRVRAGNTIIRGFEDIDWSAPVSRGTSRATEVLPLESGQEYTIEVLAINNEDLLSPVVASGPVLYSASPPPTPSLTAQYARLGVSALRTAKLNISAPEDPDTGLLGIQFAIGSQQNSDDIIAWKWLEDAGAGTSEITQLLDDDIGAGTYWVQIRSVNNAGQTSPIGRTSFEVQP